MHATDVEPGNTSVVSDRGHAHIRVTHAHAPVAHMTHTHITGEQPSNTSVVDDRGHIDLDAE